MTVRTGIPPHINQNRAIQELLGIVKEVKTNQQQQMNEVKTCIHDAFENRAMEHGNPTNESIQRVLVEVKERYNNNLNTRFDQLFEQWGGSREPRTNTAPSEQQHGTNINDTIFLYNGCFY